MSRVLVEEADDEVLVELELELELFGAVVIVLVSLDVRLIRVTLDVAEDERGWVTDVSVTVLNEVTNVDLVEEELEEDDSDSEDETDSVSLGKVLVCGVFVEMVDVSGLFELDVDSVADVCVDRISVRVRVEVTEGGGEEYTVIVL